MYAPDPTGHVAMCCDPAIVAGGAVRTSADGPSPPVPTRTTISRRGVLRATTVAAGLLVPAIASAQPYPARPVRVIVPFAPGGTTDIFARLAAQKLGERTGRQFFVENIAGASGNIATGQAARAAPDGHTLLFAFSSYVVNPTLFERIPYDPDKDKTRSQIAPDVPTMTEAGYPDIEGDSWVGVMVPAGTPAEIVASLRREIVAIIALPETRERLTTLGFDPVASTPEAFAARIRAEIALWRRVIRAGNIKPP
jgi:tripartite-type tricarboxylate transporter receptor subunit TctC